MDVTIKVYVRIIKCYLGLGNVTEAMRYAQLALQQDGGNTAVLKEVCFDDKPDCLSMDRKQT
jgi:hypothetical protein